MSIEIQHSRKPMRHGGPGPVRSGGGSQQPSAARAASAAAHTILSFGLNLAIAKLRVSRYARLLVALLILNEIRGLYVVYAAVDHGLLAWIN